MPREPRLTRRSILRGFGAAIALPWLEAMTPAARATEPTNPGRLLVFFIPNGMWMPDFTPQATGPGYDTPFMLEPIAPYADRTLVLTGLANQLSVGEPHSAANGSLLTGVTLSSESGAERAAATSVDQVIAQAIGDQTRFPSLQLGSEGSVVCDIRDVGDLEAFCDYLWHVSWRDATTPLPKETRPHVVFERLFGDVGVVESAEARAKRRLYEQSILDAVMEDAARLQGWLGHEDRQRLDAYLTGVHELEQRIRFDAPPTEGCGAAAQAWLDAHPNPELQVTEQVRQMCDLMTLAFQCDQTRVISYMLGTARSDRPYPFLGVPGAHHWLSHHGGDPSKIAQIRTIYRWEMEQYAYLLGRLAGTTQPDGSSLLDSAMVLLCCGISEPDTHYMFDLPVLLAGGTDRLNTGQHLRFENHPKLSRLHLTLLHAMGLTAVTSFGEEGTAVLPGVLR